MRPASSCGVAAVCAASARRTPWPPLIASEQQIADTFTELKLIPRKVDFGAFVDSRHNGDLPPSTTPARVSSSSHPPAADSGRSTPTTPLVEA
jgi:hypothetical protein